MIANNILKILSSGATVMQNINRNIQEKGQEIIEDNILKGKYVTREEYSNMEKRMEQLQQEIIALKSNKKVDNE